MASKPIKLVGPWDEGWVLDLHTVSSTPRGYDSLGHLQFDTVRTQLGDLVYRLKNKNDVGAASTIAEIAGQFVRDKRIQCDIIVPVPASRTRRFCPVVEIARLLSEQLNVEVCIGCVAKIRLTRQLKDVFDYRERLKELDGAFEVNREKLKGRRILLLDDLYRSGATIESVARAMRSAAPASIVVLAITKTRTRR